jgi:alpha-tubulin suppressor-like RCC1 family protein
MALRSDGTVLFFGQNAEAMLGTGVIDNAIYPPTPVAGISNVAALVGGSNIVNYAILNDGTVWGWGNDSQGGIGNGLGVGLYPPTHISQLDPFCADSGISLTDCAPGRIVNVIQIATDVNHVLALRNDGVVLSWGSNSLGQLGNGGTTNPFADVPAKATAVPPGVKYIAAGNSYSFAVTTSGLAYGWGLNGSGQLGDGTTKTRPSAVPVLNPSGTGPLTGVARVFPTFGTSTYAVMEDGSVLAWGGLGFGDLGNGLSAVDPNPKPVLMTNSPPTPISGITQIAAPTGNTSSLLMLRNDGTLWGAGNSSGSGQLGIGSRIDINLPQQTVVCRDRRDGTAIVGGFTSFTCAQLGGALAPLTNIVQVKMNFLVSIALSADGTIWEWGNLLGLPFVITTTGALSNPATSAAWPIASPVKINVATSGPAVIALGNTSSPIAGIKFTDIYLGGNGTTIAIDDHGNAWGWAYNADGELGLGNTTQPIKFPTQIPDLAPACGPSAATLSDCVTVKDVTISRNDTLVLKSDGTVWAAGDNSLGELALGFTSGLTPRLQHVTALDPQCPFDGAPLALCTRVVSLGEGFNDEIVIKSDGTVWTWGSVNANGMLGNNSPTVIELLPSQVVDPSDPSGFLTNVTQTIMTGTNAFALKADGTVWAWGAGGDGTFGNGQVANSQVPVKMNLENVIQIAATGGATFALTSDGSVWSMGTNNNGVFSRGVFAIQTLPSVIIDGSASATVAIASPPGNAITRASIPVSATVSDANPVTFSCSLDGGAALATVNGAANHQPAPVTTSLSSSIDTTTLLDGSHTLACTASDPSPNPATASNNFFVDNTPPTITGQILTAAAGTDIFGSSWWNTPVAVAFTCDDPLSNGYASGIAACSPNATISGQGAGQSVNGIAIDNAGNTASTAVSAINIDATPPSVSVSLSQTTLWPPNHNMIPITVTISATDNLALGNGTITSFTIATNEPDESGDTNGGDGFSAPVSVTPAAMTYSSDGKSGTSATTIQLRATRTGKGKAGRVYTIKITIADAAGNTTTASAASVMVPHNQ